MHRRSIPAALLLGGLALLSCPPPAGAVVTAGDPAPAFTKNVLGGGTASLADYPSKVIVLFLFGYS